MASINVDVDIDLDDLDLDEILEAVECYWNRTRKQNENREEITQFFKDLIEEEIEIPENVKLSIIDEAKVNLLASNISRININDLENLIK